MKIFLFVLLLGAFFVNLPITATPEKEEAGPVPVLEVDADLSTKTSTHIEVASKYLSFGAGISLSESPVIQGGSIIDFPGGAYISLWSSSSFDLRVGKKKGDQPDFGDETDLGVGWKRRVNGWLIDVGISYFDEPTSFDLGANDIVYSHFRASYKIGCIDLSGGWENYYSMPRSALEGGNLFSMGVSHTFQVEDWSFPLSLEGVWDDGGFGNSSGFLLKGSFGVSHSVSDSCSIGGGCRFFVPFTKDSRENDMVWWIGVTFDL